MINGIGVDIIEIERIDRAVKKNKRFLEKLFTDNEIGYFNNMGSSNTIAGAFAAKEAVVKSMGTGIRGFRWKDIEVIRDELGKPNVLLHGEAKEIANRKMITEVVVSISHCKEYAVAQAIAIYNDYDKSEKEHDTIGVIDSLGTSNNIITMDLVRRIIPKRKRTTHKGDYGKANLIAGSSGMSGAAVLASKAALRSGLGLLRLFIGESLNAAVKSNIPEAITIPLEEMRKGVIGINHIERIIRESKKVDVIAIGPGSGDTTELAEIVKVVIEEVEIPIVLDADALNALSRNVKWLESKRSPIIITPHPGEMSRLTGKSIEEINDNRVEIARDFALKWKVITVLKGADTVVASPDGEVYINETGNPGMATAGSGDVLTGIITSFIAQGIAPFQAAISGVYIHGLGGDLAAKDKGEYGMIAGDIAEQIPYAIKEVIGE